VFGVEGFLTRDYRTCIMNANHSEVRFKKVFARVLAGAFLAIFGVAVLILGLSSVLWLPDILSPNTERVMARCVNRRGESFELTQRWAGDGYLTGVRHRLPDGTSFFTVGDGDAARTFRCSAFLSTNDSSVTFLFSGKRWRYYWNLRSLSCGDGQTREPL
jgi:hypothetical protein